MDMMIMLAVLSFFYFVTLTLICLYRNKINLKYANAAFIIADVIFFFCWNLATFQRGGLKSFMTLDNISPMIFTAIPLTVFMGEKTKQHVFSAVAFLSVGMFIAMLVSPEHAYMFTFKREADLWYVSEAVCHMVCSLFGVYLVITKQVKADGKSLLKSAIFMYSVIGFGVFLNYVFHKSFFGMNPYGNYSIYMFDLFGSFEATLFAYLIGVFVVLLFGMQFGYGMEKLVSKIERHDAQKATADQEVKTPSTEKDENSRETDSPPFV